MNTDISLIRKTTKALVSFVLFILLAYIFKLFLIDDLSSIENIKNLLDSSDTWATAYFIALAAIATMIGFPRQAMAFAGGYCFGFWYGLQLSTVAATLGCMLCFFIARYLASDFINQKFSQKISYINQFLANDVFIKTIIIRFLPIGSNLITNLTAGVSNVRATEFIGGSFLGYVPQMAVFALAGSGIQLDSTNQMLISIALFGMCLLLSAMLYKRYKKNAW